MSENIYATPQAALIEVSQQEQTVATRWQRLWASLIDSFVVVLIIVPAMFFTGGLEQLASEHQQSLGYDLALGAIGLVLFMLLNGYLLTKYGQTIGKKVIGIKIVDLDGNHPTWSQHLLKRYSVYLLPGSIPVVGQFLSFVNVLTIFASEKRCIHDYAAGTKVVKIGNSTSLPPTHVEFEKTSDVSEDIRRYKEAQRNAVDRN